MMTSAWLEAMFVAQTAGTGFGLPETVALAAVAAIGYLFGRRTRSTMGETVNEKRQQELERAVRIAWQLESIADSLRRDLSAWGIKVSVIEPGAISTPIWQKSISRADKVLQTMPERAKQLYGKRIELARDNAVKMSNGAIPAIEVAKGG